MKYHKPGIAVRCYIQTFGTPGVKRHRQLDWKAKRDPKTGSLIQLHTFDIRAARRRREQTPGSYAGQFGCLTTGEVWKQPVNDKMCTPWAIVQLSKAQGTLPPLR